MARSSDPDSASSQFFIVQADSTFLDGDYAAFGHVTEGMNVVDKICKDAVPTDDNGTIESEKQPVIESITIKDCREISQESDQTATENTDIDPGLQESLSVWSAAVFADIKENQGYSLMIRTGMGGWLGRL